MKADTERLVRSLNDHGVKFVIIGAAALPVHGYGRVTLDIDFFIEPTEENARRTLAALTAYGYDVSDLNLKELLTLKILFRGYATEADVHPMVEGVTFDDVWSRRVSDHVGTTPACFASLDDLIRMKEAAGRPKDLEDLKYLRRIRDTRKKS